MKGENMNRKEKLGKFFYIVLALCIMIIGGVIGLTIYKNQQENQPGNGMENQEIEEIQSLENSRLEDEKDDEIQKEETFLFFEITNRNEHVDPILKQWAYKANEGLTQYVEENELQATQAACFEAEMLNGETIFYFECNDSEKTTLELTYNHNDRTVEVKETDYSREDMMEKAQLIGGDSLLLEEQE